MGPLWDFDGAFSYAGDGENIYFERTDYRIRLHPFFQRFFDDPVFTARYRELWNQYYTDGTITGIVTFVDDMAVKLDASQKANFTVWEWLNHPNYAHEIAKMKSWLSARIAYLNTETGKMAE
jgi:spore coat protein CotH